MTPLLWTLLGSLLAMLGASGGWVWMQRRDAQARQEGAQEQAERQRQAAHDVLEHIRESDERIDEETMRAVDEVLQEEKELLHTPPTREDVDAILRRARERRKRWAGALLVLALLSPPARAERAAHPPLDLTPREAKLWEAAVLNEASAEIAERHLEACLQKLAVRTPTVTVSLVTPPLPQPEEQGWQAVALVGAGGLVLGVVIGAAIVAAAGD